MPIEYRSWVVLQSVAAISLQIVRKFQGDFQVLPECFVQDNFSMCGWENWLNDIKHREHSSAFLMESVVV